MSKFNYSSGDPIPMGILVKAAKKAKNAEPPGPGRKREGGERQVPWMWIAVGGSVGWVIVVLVVAILTWRQEQSLEVDGKPPPRPIAVDGPAADALPQLVAAKPVVAEIAERMPAPVAPGPKLVRKVKPNDADEAPPAIDIVPDDLKPALPVAAPAPAPPPPAPAARNAAFKEVDTKVYVDCQQVGTNVLFMRDPLQASQRAAKEKKLMFVVHLSGNLEDPGFT
jgi:hypothetical protein